MVTLTVVASDGATSQVARAVSLGRATHRKPASAAAVGEVPTVFHCGPRLAEDAPADITANGGPPAGCTDTITFDLIQAAGCMKHVTDSREIPASEHPVLDEAVREYNQNPRFREYTAITSGPFTRTGTALLAEFALDASDVYISDKTVRINGLDFEPKGGAVIVLFPQIGRVVSSNARVGIASPVGSFAVRKGQVNLDVRKPAQGDRITIGSFDAASLPSVGGFKLDGKMEIAFVGGFRTEAAVQMALPNVFSATPGSGDKITGRVTLKADNATALHLDGIDLRVPSAFLGVLQVEDLSFSYREEGNVWEGSGAILFGPSGIRLDMRPPPAEYGVGFRDGNLSHAGGMLDFGNSPPPIFPGVFLQEIHFAIGTRPTVLRGGITLGVGKVVEVKADVLVAFASPQNPYTLRNAPAPLARFEGTKFSGLAIAAAGQVGLRVPVLGRIPFAQGYFLYADGENAFVAAGGGVDLSVLGIFSVKGGVDGEFGLDNGRFNVSGNVDACIKHVPIKGDLCVGVAGLVSSEGIVVCGEVGPFEPGAGYHWGGSVELFIWDCDMGPYRANVRGSRAGDARTFTVGSKGLPSEMLRLEGDGGPPRVTVRAPDGVEYSTPEEGWDPGDKRFASIRQTNTNTTWIGINDPRPGTYTVTPLPDSPRITAMATADALPEASIDATVTGAQAGAAHSSRAVRRRTLRYRIRPRPGQKVTFVEHSPDSLKVLGSVTGGSGALRFTPADGGAGMRTIEAQISIRGLMTHTMVVDRYRAPAPPRAGKPHGLKVKRRGTGLLVRWGRAANVDHWSVVVRQRNGARRVLTPRGNRHLARVARVPRTQQGTVTVRGVTRRGAIGPAAVARFRATARVPTRFDRYRRGPGRGPAVARRV